MPLNDILQTTQRESLSASQIKHGSVFRVGCSQFKQKTSDNATMVHYIAYPSLGSNMESNLCSRYHLT